MGKKFRLQEVQQYKSADTCEGCVLDEIPLDRGFAGDERDSGDIPSGYWRGFNMIPYDFGGLRGIYEPADSYGNPSGTVTGLHIDNAGVAYKPPAT